MPLTSYISAYANGCQIPIYIQSRIMETLLIIFGLTLDPVG
jgi:hypothetical protein